jgi:hypothetical protein
VILHRRDILRVIRNLRVEASAKSEFSQYVDNVVGEAVFQTKSFASFSVPIELRAQDGDIPI